MAHDRHTLTTPWNGKKRNRMRQPGDCVACGARRIVFTENYRGNAGECIWIASWPTCFLFPLNKSRLKRNCERLGLKIFQMEFVQAFVSCLMNRRSVDRALLLFRCWTLRAFWHVCSNRGQSGPLHASFLSEQLCRAYKHALPTLRCFTVRTALPGPCWRGDVPGFVCHCVLGSSLYHSHYQLWKCGTHCNL